MGQTYRGVARVDVVHFEELNELLITDAPVVVDVHRFEDLRGDALPDRCSKLLRSFPDGGLTDGGWAFRAWTTENQKHQSVSESINFSIFQSLFFLKISQ